MNSLLPCPFCGKTPVTPPDNPIFGVYSVFCRFCIARSPARNTIPEE